VPSYYLTTPIYYASGEPHLGHAYTTILADVLARYKRTTGAEVLFLTGTDEHGQKIQEAAAEQGMEPLALCDLMAERFEVAWKDLGISHDRFIRTTEQEHIDVVQAFLTRLWDEGHIYEANYSGWYSVSQERYFTEKEAGKDRLDPITGKPLVKIEEKNYFFRMSVFQDRLIKQIEDNPNWIVPKSRSNEILGFLKSPLEDLSISRPSSRVKWGVPLPFDSEHVTYVWVDALINYLTASGAIDPSAEVGHRGFAAPTESRWPADLHLVGKDIITTHAVYWPTLLMGAGLELPRQILAHGWWVVEGTKMSKSLGNVVDPLELRTKFGTDAVRWYLVREMSTGQDASYTPERFLARYDELSNILGNLVHRVVAMVIKYRDGVVPNGPDQGLSTECHNTLTAIQEAMANFRLHDALGAAMDLARSANGYIETQEPWALAKDAGAGEKLDETLASLIRCLGYIATIFAPVLPEKSQDLAERIGLERILTIPELSSLDLGGASVDKRAPLFPRADVKT